MLRDPVGGQRRASAGVEDRIVFKHTDSSAHSIKCAATLSKNGLAGVEGAAEAVVIFVEDVGGSVSTRPARPTMNHESPWPSGENVDQVSV